MHDSETRTAALRLSKEGHSVRAIARALGISRGAVGEILARGAVAVVRLERPERLTPHIEQIRTLYARCKGNLVRVQEELFSAGIDVPYSTVTGFCRRHGIGQTPKERAGEYHFEPGEEMQHDTSPHTVEVGGKKRKLQCASVVLCYSRRIYAQCYPTFNRFYAKAFHTEAFQHWQGLAGRDVVDNTSVIVAHGTGKNAVPAPEMAAFAERFGFDWFACELQDPDRKGRVERPFHYIEHNFYPGRTFTDLADLNRQMREWCDRVDHKPRRRLGASPIELFAIEQTLLKPLPLYVPEVYALHLRTIDLDGFVHLHTNRYSVPDDLIDHDVEVRETLSRVRVIYRHEVVVDHERIEDGAKQSRTLPEHKKKRHPHGAKAPPIPEEGTLRAAAPEFGVLVDRLRVEHGGRAVRPIRRLYRMFVDYPTESLVAGVRSALEYGLLDLERIEGIVLRRIAGDFFRQPTEEDDHGR
jgi:predicted transcriptional regulator